MTTTTDLEHSGSVGRAQLPELPTVTVRSHRKSAPMSVRATGSKMVVGLVSAGTALSVAAGVALADPPINPAPPMSNPAPETTNPTPAPEPAPAPSNTGPGVIPDPPSDSGWQANPWTPNAPATWAPSVNTPSNDAPVMVGPVYVPPPPPMILPQPGFIRIGTYQTVKPTWVTMAEMNSINRWSAYIESRIAQGLQTINPKLTQDKAMQQAASMMIGGAVGGVAGGGAGFVIGAIPGAAIGTVAGAGIGALVGTGIGAGIGFATGIPLLPFIPGFPISQAAVGALIGAPVGAAIGAGLGALGGGIIGGTIVGVPGAALGVGLGSIFGRGDPNEKIDQPWEYRDGQGKITPKPNVLEFDWDATHTPLLNNVKLPEDAHVNLEVKDDDTWALKLGKERWFGATKEQRQTYFYDEINKRVAGAGDVTSNFLEDKNGVFQNTVRDWLGQIAKKDPKNAQYNPKGDIADPSKREVRVPYPTSSTPDQWDEPNRNGVDEQNRANRDSGSTPPTTSTGQAAPQSAPATVSRDAALSVTVPSHVATGGSDGSSQVQLSAPVSQAVDSAPAPVAQAVHQAINTAPAPVQSAISQASTALAGLTNASHGAHAHR